MPLLDKIFVIALVGVAISFFISILPYILLPKKVKWLVLQEPHFSSTEIYFWSTFPYNYTFVGAMANMSWGPPRFIKKRYPDSSILLNIRKQIPMWYRVLVGLVALIGMPSLFIALITMILKFFI